jgi:hypothetical protein
MKIVYYLMTLLTITIIPVIFQGCEKHNEPSPLFTVTYTQVTLQDGTEGVEFWAYCYTTDVKMTKVDILDPGRTNTITYKLNNVIYLKGETFGLQDVNVGYLKVGGIYQFTFTGNRLSDNSGFATQMNLNVAK